MNKAIKKIAPILVIGLFLFNPLVSLGQNYEAENQEIKDINKEIEASRGRIKKMREQQEIYSRAIAQKQKEKATLNNQLAILENRLAKAALDITSAQVEIDRTNLEIEKINLEIKDKDGQILRQKEHIASVIRLMQKQDGQSTLEILLLNDTLNEFISQAKYLADINKKINQGLEFLKQYKKDLEEKQNNLTKVKKELVTLKSELENKKKTLASEQQTKVYVLDQTKSSEKEYQRLLILAREEQQQAEANIVNLEKVVRARIAKLSGKTLEFNDSGFIWPVPKNTVTAYFHDPDYPYRYIFEHPAIDLATPQGTAIKAVDSGYVAKTKDGGKYGYSYIMIVHSNGLSSVYGHVNKISTETDQFVTKGQIIGYSGGMPGTNGAGTFSTGPHLHLEIRLNGVPVDPLNYLP